MASDPHTHVKSALLIIDLQNDFLPGGSLAVPAGDEVIPIINGIVSDFDFDVIVCTADAHTADHVSFASSHPGPPPLYTELVLPDGTRQMLWPPHCVEGTTGAQLASALARPPGSRIVRKGTYTSVDSYSGFGDSASGAVERTELDDVLRRAGVERVYVAGLALDYCVGFTCRDAARLGYATTCLAWASRGISDASIAQEVAAMWAAGVKVAVVPGDGLEGLPRRQPAADSSDAGQPGWSHAHVAPT